MRGILTAIALIACTSTSALAQSNDPFVGLNGLWVGGGKVVLANDKTENIKCRNTYSGESRDRKLRIRCATTDFKFDVDAEITLVGNILKGSWTEHTHGNTGNISGNAYPGNIVARIGGTHLSAIVSITTNSSTQKVSIVPQAQSLKKIEVTLTRQHSN